MSWSGRVVFRRLAPALGALILAAQVGSVTYAHVAGDRRYFAWAPNDYASVYTINVSVGGHQLSPQQVQARYQLAAHGLWEDPPQRLIDFLNRYETTYGKASNATVVLRYSLDGHPLRTWRRP